MRAWCGLTPPAGRLCPDGTGPAAPDCIRQITPSPALPLQAALKATRAGNGSAQPRAAAFDDRDIPDRRLGAARFLTDCEV
jgi:hypothetical protein